MQPLRLDTSFIDAAFLILLGRGPTAIERRNELRSTGDPARRALVTRLLSSPEAAGRRTILTADDDAVLRTAPINALFAALGSDETFVAYVYQCVLGRVADPGGLSHYAKALAAGEPRVLIVRALMQSSEFRDRVAALVGDAGLIPRDVQLCELANPAKWDNDEWLDILRSLGLSDDKPSMHRKPYEFTQLVFGCRRLGVLTDQAKVISVGAGHELVLYWLANHAGHVIATDMYEGVWQDVQGREGDPDVVNRPDDYAPFAYRKDRLSFLKMDGRRLAFADGTFDIAYSLSSIEHFGGMPGAQATIKEMARVLRPGGILALATEYVIAGPPHDETFQPAEFAELITQPGLELVQPIDTAVYQRYEYRPIDLYTNPYQTPHMVVRFDDTVFTTVMVFLRKL
jgi:SAM-dependent methyltransferase